MLNSFSPWSRKGHSRHLEIIEYFLAFVFLGSHEISRIQNDTLSKTQKA